MIKRELNQQTKVFLLYDVACLLKRHLEVCIMCTCMYVCGCSIIYEYICMYVYTYLCVISLCCFNLKQKRERSDLLTAFNLAVPVFHSYGHKVDCQVMLLLYLTMSSKNFW